MSQSPHHGLRQIWGLVQALGRRQRHHGVPNDQSVKAQLTQHSDKPSTFPFSLYPQKNRSFTKTSRTGGGITLLEDATADRETTTGDEMDDCIASNPQRRGWIDGVYLCAKASAAVLLLHVIFIAIAAGLASKYPENSGFSSLAVFYRGSCVLSQRWNTALHLIINVLSTGILAASSYCMQTLVAPTREEIDDVHARSRWLDIGNASVNNLFAIPRYRLALWLVLFITATPFHLLYNSVVFPSSSTNEYDVVLGPKDLDSKNIWNLTTPALEKCFTTIGAPNWHQFASNIARENYDRLTANQCTHFTQNASPFGTKGIIALAADLSVSDGGNACILSTGFEGGFGEGRYTGGPEPITKRLQGRSFSSQHYGLHGYSTNCTNEFTPMDPKKHLIHGCLAVKADEYCELIYSPPICIVIALTASVKVVAMFLAGRTSRTRSAPLLTIGDAIASFLERPDPTTQGFCWMSHADIRRGNWTPSRRAQGTVETLEDSDQHPPIIYKKLVRRKFWVQAPSVKRWLATLIMCALTIGAGIFFLEEFIAGGSPTKFPLLTISDLGYLWNSGLNNYRLVSPTIHLNTLSSVVAANTPQLVISLSYYGYNNVLTSMLVAAEYSSYAVARKPLRVTWPLKGSQQRSTYWLSLPYQYNIPILVIYMILHWLISESFFYVLTIPYALDQPDMHYATRSLGYSALPIFLSLLVGSFMLLILFGLALRRFKSDIPLAGVCSAAISAACHPPEDDLDTAALGPVRWGETTTLPAWMSDHSGGPEGQKGHCSFTSLDTMTPSLTKLYA